MAWLRIVLLLFTRRAWFAVLLIGVALAPSRADALDRFCDSSFEDCRASLLNFIKAEQKAIDVGMWFMEDARFSAELARRKAAGVQIRILMDPRSTVQHPDQEAVFTQLRAAGIQMRNRTASGIEHWKIMLFEGQNVLYFGSANFSEDAFVPAAPYVNYTDETVYFTDDGELVNSIKTRFDDAWTNTSSYANYANVQTPLVRRYDRFDVISDLNVPPGEDFIDRSVSRINAEKSRLDVMMYRIADERATAAMIAAHRRGVAIRLLVDPQMYRDPTRLDIAFHLDRLYAAGIPTRFTAHQGLNHGKLVLLHNQGGGLDQDVMTIFGSANFTTPSANSQHENNLFTRKHFIFDYFLAFFERRWKSNTETKAFVAQPPDKPVYSGPAPDSTGLSPTGVKLKWTAGPWGQYYDIYLGTTATPPLSIPNVHLGASTSSAPTQSYTLPALSSGTTYYWQIVSKTAAGLTKAGPIWSFKTSGTAPTTPITLPGGAKTRVLWAARAAATDRHGDWVPTTDAATASGQALLNANQNRAKVAPASASPANYFEMKFDAVSGAPYHVWIRMRAADDATSNDSVHLQFSDAVDAASAPLARIGSSGSAEFVLQAGPSGAAPHGYGWADNGWGSPGAPIYFAASGTHTLRVQQREDGAIVDQIVLSPDTYANVSPGTRRDDVTSLATTEPGSSGGQPEPEPQAPSGSIVLWTGTATVDQLHGSWTRVADGTAAGGWLLANPNADAAKIAPALGTPANYVDLTFTAEGGTPYHIWLRMRAAGDSYTNDSVHLQLDNAVDPSGAPFALIGSNSSAEFVLQAGPGGIGPHGWGWTENGWGAPGPDIVFAAGGTHTLRIQQREDGVSIDQVVLKSGTGRTTAPGERIDDATILSPR